MATENIGDDAAPGTLGQYQKNYIYYQKVATNNAGTVTSLHFYVLTAESGGAVKCAIYTDSGGDPGDLVSNSVTNEVNWAHDSEWVDFTFSTNPTILATTDYWIGIWTDANYSRAKGAGGTGNWCWESRGYDGFPATAARGGSLEDWSDMDAYMVVEFGVPTFIPKVIMIT